MRWNFSDSLPLSSMRTHTLTHILLRLLFALVLMSKNQNKRNPLSLYTYNQRLTWQSKEEEKKANYFLPSPSFISDVSCRAKENKWFFNWICFLLDQNLIRQEYINVTISIMMIIIIIKKEFFLLFWTFSRVNNYHHLHFVFQLQIINLDGRIKSDWISNVRNNG